jgi:hypothetical protein
MSIIMMQRKLYAANDSSNSPAVNESSTGASISLNAARKVLDIMNLLMESFKSPWLIAWIWGAYQCPIAIASIYDNVLSKQNDANVLADWKQISRAEALLNNSVRLHADLKPLWKAFATLNIRVSEHRTDLHGK